MLEDVKQSYITRADNIVPGWNDLDVNILSNLYVENENDDTLREGYFSAIILKKWGYIGKYYNMSRASGFSIEDCYDMVCDALLYILNKHKWTDPNSKLYKDKYAPDKCINRAIMSTRQRYYYLSNRDKRKGNFGKVSLDHVNELVGDHSEIFNDYKDTISENDNVTSSILVKDLVSKLFENNKLIEALVVDNIVNDDCFTYSKKSEATAFKLSKLVNNLAAYDIKTLRTICDNYCVDSNVVSDLSTILNSDKHKLSKIVSAALKNLYNNRELKNNLCC